MRVRVGLTAWEMCPVIFVGTYNAGMWSYIGIINYVRRRSRPAQ